MPIDDKVKQVQIREDLAFNKQFMDQLRTGTVGQAGAMSMVEPASSEYVASLVHAQAKSPMKTQMMAHGMDHGTAEWAMYTDAKSTKGGFGHMGVDRDQLKLDYSLGQRMSRALVKEARDLKDHYVDAFSSPKSVALHVSPLAQVIHAMTAGGEADYTLDDYTNVINGAKHEYTMGPVESGVLRGVLGQYAEDVAGSLGVQLMDEDKAQITQALSKFAAFLIPYGIMTKIVRMGVGALSVPIVRTSIAQAIAKSPQAMNALRPLGKVGMAVAAGGGAGVGMALLDKEHGEDIMKTAALFAMFDGAFPALKFGRVMWGKSHLAKEFHSFVEQKVKNAPKMDWMPELMNTRFMQFMTNNSPEAQKWAQKMQIRGNRFHEEWLVGSLSRMDDELRRIKNRYQSRVGMTERQLSSAYLYGMKKLRTPEQRKLFTEMLAYSKAGEVDKRWKLAADTGRRMAGMTKKETDAVRETLSQFDAIRKNIGKDAVDLGLGQDQVYVDNMISYFNVLRTRLKPGTLQHERAMRLYERFIKMPETSYNRAELSHIVQDVRAFKKLPEVPAWMKADLGEIEHGVYLSAKTLSDVNKSVEMQRMYGEISRKVDMFMDADVAKDYLFKYGNRYVDTQAGTRWIKAKGEQWGPLNGGFLREDIYASLVENRKFPEFFMKWYGRNLTRWKTSRTVWRPSTHARNIITNFVLNDIGGLPFYRMDMYAKAAGLMNRHAKGKLRPGEQKIIDTLIEEGIWDSGMVRHELSDVFKIGLENPELYDRRIGGLLNMAKGGRRGALKVHQVMAELYAAEERWAKTAKFLHNRQKGIDPRAAAEDAMKWTLNYADTSKALEMVRLTAMPFATFTFKVMPRLAEAAVVNPVRFAKWPIGIAMAQKMALKNLNITEAEWERYHNMLPEYMRAGYFFLMPWRDKHNRLQFTDLTYILPWGDMGEFQQNFTGRLLQNPLYNVYSEIDNNKNYAGMPIWYDFESPWVKAAKVAGHVSQTFMPTFFPGGTDYNRMHRLAFERHHPKSQTAAQALAATFGPFKITPRREQDIVRSHHGKTKRHLAESRRKLRFELDRAKSVTKREKLRAQHREELKRILGR